jgi:hypothetical protein
MCYTTNVHDLSHPFLRFDRPGAGPIRLRPRSPAAHDCICDGCGRQYFLGTRYKCAVCNDYDLCMACYLGNNLHAFSHAFKRIDRPGCLPIQLALRLNPTPHAPTPALR